MRRETRGSPRALSSPREEELSFMPGALPGSPAVGGDATFPADPAGTAAQTPQGPTSTPRARPTPAKTLRSKITPGCLLFPDRGGRSSCAQGAAASYQNRLEQFQFEMLCILNHTACRFAEKAQFFRLLWAGRRCAAASRFTFFKVETL